MTFQSSTLVHYPESDGQPMTESDPTRDYLAYCVEALELFFRSRRQIYVSGNLFVYYEKDNPKAVVAPDVFVVFGVSKRKRRIYRTWEEANKVPAFVIEITSRTTRKQDEATKPDLYAQLGVQEYFQYDPTGDYLKPQLKASQLVNGKYKSMPSQTKGDGTRVIHSAVLGLDLCLLADGEALLRVAGDKQLPRLLRFYDPQTGEMLPNYAESIAARDQERERADQERERAEQERERAGQERDRADRERERAEQAEQAQQLAIPKLLALGLAPEQVADTLGLSIEAINRIRDGHS